MKGSELFEKAGGIRIESKSIADAILLFASVVYGCSLDVQRHIVLFGAGEHCVVKVSSAQGTFFTS